MTSRLAGRQRAIFMPHRPKLSIITPSLNQGPFIERTIRSVLDQGYENLEYLIADGGSTDGSVAVIERYQDRLAWWVTEPDQGQPDALNKALRHATGEWVAYINSDDYYLPGAFDTVASAFEATGAQWIVGTCRFVDTEDRPTTLWVPKPPPRGRHQWILAPWGAPQPATFWRRGLFERFGPFREDMPYVFDVEYGLRLIFASVPPVIVEGELATRVMHPEAKSWDPAPYGPERRRFVGLYAARLTPRERIALRTAQALQALGWYRVRAAAGRAKRRMLRGGTDSSGIVRLRDERDAT